MPTPSDKPSRGRVLMLIAIGAVVVFALMTGDAKAWLNAAISEVEQLGAWGPVVFVVCYIVATVLMVPGSALTLAAGTLFGVVYGTGLVSVASTLGASAAFLIGRFLARDSIVAVTSRRPAFAALDRALGKDGWKIVALARLSPVFPFTLLNYAFGVTQVKFTHYVLASWIAMLPGTVLYVYLGSLAREGVRSAARTPMEWTIYAIGLVATLAVTWLITRMTRRAIGEASLASNASATDVPS